LGGCGAQKYFPAKNSDAERDAYCETWATKASTSIGTYARQYGLSGIEVNYEALEGSNNSRLTFGNCIGKLAQKIKVWIFLFFTK
jgi:hypothetical protein